MIRSVDKVWWSWFSVSQLRFKNVELKCLFFSPLGPKRSEAMDKREGGKNKQNIRNGGKKKKEKTKEKSG